MTEVLARRTFLAWLSGVLAGLVAVPAAARPRRPRVYPDTYGDSYS